MGHEVKQRLRLLSSSHRRSIKKRVTKRMPKEQKIPGRRRPEQARKKISQAQREDEFQLTKKTIANYIKRHIQGDQESELLDPRRVFHAAGVKRLAERAGVGRLEEIASKHMSKSLDGMGTYLLALCKISASMDNRATINENDVMNAAAQMGLQV